MCQWADSLVNKIDLYVDGDYASTADLMCSATIFFRPIRGLPHSYARPGFVTSLISCAYAYGAHTLVGPCHIQRCDCRRLRPSITVDNDYNQAPFGELELPGSNQPMNGVFPITGWALDDESIDFVEIMSRRIGDGQRR